MTNVQDFPGHYKPISLAIQHCAIIISITWWTTQFNTVNLPDHRRVTTVHWTAEQYINRIQIYRKIQNQTIYNDYLQQHVHSTFTERADDISVKYLRMLKFQKL